MSQSQPNPKSRKSNWTKAFAFFAVALIAAIAVHGIYLMNAQKDAQTQAVEGAFTEEQAAADIDRLLEDLDSGLETVVAQSDPDAYAAAQEAYAQLEAAIQEGRIAVVHASDNAKVGVVDAAGATGALPRVPEGFASGDLTGATDVAVSGYGVPDFEALGLDAVALDQAAWAAQLQAIAQGQGTLPPEAAGALGDVDDQIQSNGPLVQSIYGIVLIADPTGQAPQDPLMLIPSLSDPEGALQPDDEAARQAYDLAMTVLGNAESYVGASLEDTAALEALLAEIEAQQQELVSTLDAQVAATQDLQVQASEDLQAELEQNLADVQTQADAKIGQVQQAVDDYTSRVDTQGDLGLDAIDEAVTAHEAQIRAVAASGAADLRAQADTLKEDAQVTAMDINSRADAAVAQLETLGALYDVDVAEQIAVVRSDADAAVEEVLSRAETSESYLRAEAEKLEADAEAQLVTLFETAAGAEAEIQSAVTDAKAFAQEAGVYGVQEAQARAEALAAAHTEAAASALVDVQTDAQAHIDGLWTEAFAINQDAADTVDAVEDIVGDLRDDINSVVETNIANSYIGIVEEVVEDYKTRTAEGAIDPEDAYAQWSAALETATSLQAGVETEATQRLGQALLVEQAIAQAQAELTSFTGF